MVAPNPLRTRWSLSICAASLLAASAQAQTPVETPPSVPQIETPSAPANPLPPSVSAPTGVPVATLSILTEGCNSDGACSEKPPQSRYRYQKFFWPIGYPGIAPTGPGYYSAADCIHGNCRENPPKGGYPRFFANPTGFFDNDFSYVDDPKYTPTWDERLHRLHLDDDWMFGTGGEFRMRYDDEQNSRLSGKVNPYTLTRLRLFGELWYRDLFRVYAEFISANSSHQNLPPALTDRDYADILNLFVDVKTLTVLDEPVYVRAGRQQILLGSQRIISPSDWANSMRTFDGVRAYRRSEKFDVDAFWLRPVVPNATAMNTWDVHTQFAGIYTQYRRDASRFLDLYWLYLDTTGQPAQQRLYGVGPLQPNAPYYVHTLGYRYGLKTKSNWLFESESMYQMGEGRAGNIQAGNTSNGVGYNFKNAPWNPTFWAYYDYATGSDRVGGPNTFNQLFPLGHYYLGWIDYVGRANIQDVNFHLYLYPTKWITFNAQYHIFDLANARDALYSTGGGVLRSDPTGRSGTNVGQETDFIINWHLTRNTDIVTAYSHFYAGEFVQRTGSSANTDTFYFIYNVRW
jgi:hypothetical protein